jgi:hypothetical protein
MPGKYGGRSAQEKSKLHPSVIVSDFRDEKGKSVTKSGTARTLKEVFHSLMSETVLSQPLRLSIKSRDSRENRSALLKLMVRVVSYTFVCIAIAR